VFRLGCGELAVIMIFGIPLAAIVCGSLVAIVKAIKGDGAARNRRLDEEQTRMMQEIFRGLEKMEKRVEALETLLQDREGRDRI